MVRIAFEYEEVALARATLETTLGLFEAALAGDVVDLDAAVESLRPIYHAERPGLSTDAVIRAARRRGIPTRRMYVSSLVVLGQGARQRRIAAAETDRTNVVAATIAQDKELTKQFLRAGGIPVPSGRPVEDADDAWRAARVIGLPVVVKPRDTDLGKGVALHLNTREQVIAAYEEAHAASDSILVEQFAEGATYRLLIVAGRLVAAARREPPRVLGDGESTVAQLVANANRDPRRGDGPLSPLRKIVIDGTACGVLDEQGLTPESVPGAGVPVVIRRNIEYRHGGTVTDVTAAVHPEVERLAVDAARIVGLDIAGLDIVARDISRPLEDQGGVIVEVNPGPGLDLHIKPWADHSQPVGEAIVASLFPDPRDDGRIPIIAVAEAPGSVMICRLAAWLLGFDGGRVGMATATRRELDGRALPTGDDSGCESARDLLLNPNIDRAVFEVSARGFREEGLGFDECQIGVLTQSEAVEEGGARHSGLRPRDFPDQVPVRGYRVLNAEDPLTAARIVPGDPQLIAIARDGAHPALEAHRERGGRIAFPRRESIILVEGTDPERTLAVPPFWATTHRAPHHFNTELVLLAAVSAAWAMDIPVAAIANRLATFEAPETPAASRRAVASTRP